MLPRLALLLLLALPVRAASETFYLGTYTNGANSQGIYSGTLDTITGRLGPLRLAAAVRPDPTFLAFSPDRRFLFAALGDAVASFAIEPAGVLSAIDRRPSGGKNMCFVTLDRSGRHLFAASYDSGFIAMFPVGTDGQIGPRRFMIPFSGSGPNRDRQQSSHPHSIYIDPKNRFLYVCDLGADRIWIFRLGENGMLTPGNPLFVRAQPGSGPRHLVFSPDGKQIYVANELNVTTSVFQRDSGTGALTLVQTLDNFPPGWPRGTGSAEIVLHPSGRWLYVSTRLRDFMTVFRVNADFDKLRLFPIRATPDPLAIQETVPAPVKFPRSFAIDPTGKWLVIAGETNDRISVMKIDPADGHLMPTGQFETVGRPVCVLFRP